MAYTQAMLDELEKSIALGALRVRFGDKEVIYRDLNDMLRVRRMMRVALGYPVDPTSVTPTFSKGLC